MPIECQTIMTQQAKSERVGVSQVAQITGMSFRTIQQRAAWGLIPSAAKLGGNWSFDEAAIRLWVQQQEQVTAKKKIFFSANVGSSYGYVTMQPMSVYG